MLVWFCDANGTVSLPPPRLLVFINKSSLLLFAQVHVVLELSVLAMAFFKDVLIRDSKARALQKHQTFLSVDETKINPSFPANLEKLCEGEDDIPNIEELEILDCEKFENLFLIGKLLGESVSIKIIMSKTKTDWAPSVEVRYVDMGKGFILIKFMNELDCSHVFFD